MSEKVRNMFSNISGKYDLMNNVLSLGIHKSWRKRTVRGSIAGRGKSVLDCASGTGDLAIDFYRAVMPGGKVTATDFSREMLDVARSKFDRQGLPIQTRIEDVMSLSFPDATFDISSIAFGIRNVDDTLGGLRELARVVKPGGQVVVLEFGQATGAFRYLYNLYSRLMIPAVGRIIAGNRDAYDYLQETAARFPCRERFLDLMRMTGMLTDMRYVSLSSGIAYIYYGRKK
ncbi:MAG: ubiquinone/menaquinone biosynthesis methyltransferase [Bacteroidota bacterium]